MRIILRRIPGVLLVIGVILTAVLNSGTVRRKQGHVSKTQTDAIKLKDKMEELKDGEKGPATPTFGWYGGKNGFMSAPPFSKESKESSLETSGRAVPKVSEVGVAASSFGAEDFDENRGDSEDVWDEDWAEEDGKEDEALGAKDDIVGDTASFDAPPRGSDTSKEDQASKWDKDWWDEI